MAASAAPPAVAQDVVVNPDPVDNTPQILEGKTEAVADLGSRVLIGGQFTQVRNAADGSPRITRTNLFAYTKATGEIDTTFDPRPDGQVTAMLVAADGKVYVAGQFKNFGGSAAPYLVKIDPVTGTPDPVFAAVPDGMVYDIQLANGLLYLGGTFGRVNGVVRTNFAMVDPSTGALQGANVPFDDPVAGIPLVSRFDITADGTQLVAIGNFTSVAGQFRQNIAKLNLSGSSATVDGWNTDVYRFGQCNDRDYLATWVKDIDISPDGSYFVVVAIGGWHGTSAYCDTAARWEMSQQGRATSTWQNYSGGDSLTAVATTGAAVYVGGHQRWMNNPLTSGGTKGPGAVGREGIAALDPASGLPLSWNPGRERGFRVWRIVPTPDGMYILSDSSGFAGEWHPRLTYLLTAGGTPPVVAIASTTPTELAYTIGKRLYQREFTGTTVGPAERVRARSWEQVRGVVRANDRTYRFKTNGTLDRSIDGHKYQPRTIWTNDFKQLAALTYVPAPAAGGQVIYATTGDGTLRSRGFGVENGLVAGLTATVSGPAIDGMSWSDVRGLAVVDGALYHTHADGTLRRTQMVGVNLVASSTVTISGPGIDGIDWSKTRGLNALPSS